MSYKWKVTAVLSVFLTAFWSVAPAALAAEQLPGDVRKAFADLGVDQEKAEELLRELSPSEIQYILDNPDLQKPLGQGAPAAAAALLLLLLLLLLLTITAAEHDARRAREKKQQQVPQAPPPGYQYQYDTPTN